jgi:predicted nuclease of restriction endonuclease-like (RecB) superfamily
MKAQKSVAIYDRIRGILESARSNIARSVNSTQVVANWLIGREIVEEEQGGRRRADYGTRLVADLAERLTKDFGRGFTKNNLEHFRAFYLTYPNLVSLSIAHAARGESGAVKLLEITHAARGQLDSPRQATPASATTAKIPVPASVLIHSSLHGAVWKPGNLHLHLSWTHYRTLLRVNKTESRSFYEIEAIKNGWSARELERQIHSLLYERLALSKDKKGLMKLARKGQEVQKPADIFKDPTVIEFLELPESPKLVETDLEQALINNLQAFLLEMGKGFAFVSRQERITIDGDHFYVDLVFYHTILKCFVLLDLKVGKLTHQDLGQLQLYVNYYDSERRTKGDQPTLGLILCTDKNEAVVRYTLGKGYRKNVFASRYQLYVPSEAELKAELRRELRFLHSGNAKGGKP